jgi:hypothetical protein
MRAAPPGRTPGICGVGRWRALFAKVSKDVANLAAANLLEAVKGSRDRAIELIKQEAHHQLASKALTLLAAVRAPADAVRLLRSYPYKPKPEPNMEINLD